MMKQKLNFILMADIIHSRKADQHQLMKDFRLVTENVNKSNPDLYLSPITITLGDEFQAIAKDLQSAIEILFHLEETKVALNKDFYLRYVLWEGRIETPINTKIAYGMMGSGLTNARAALLGLKKTKLRFHIVLQDKKLENAIQNAFLALQWILDDWNSKRDYYIVAEFLQTRDYKTVARELDKNNSLIWKREKGLRINEYFALKEVINYLGGKTNA
jgi:hypothetical protein